MHDKLTNKQQLLADCDGIEVVSGSPGYGGYRQTLFVVKPDVTIIPPSEIYIEVISSSTKGTIGKLIDITFNTQNRLNEKNETVTVVDQFSIKYIIEIEGRKKPSSISSYFSEILINYTGKTKWVRNIVDHTKEVIKNPVNKFKQQLQKDDWIVGVGMGGDSLKIGKVTRWTKNTVWAKTIDGEEFRLSSIAQTFLMPSSNEHLTELTMAIVKGWNGK